MFKILTYRRKSDEDGSKENEKQDKKNLSLWNKNITDTHPQYNLFCDNEKHD